MPSTSLTSPPYHDTKPSLRDIKPLVLSFGEPPKLAGGAKQMQQQAAVCHSTAAAAAVSLPPLIPQPHAAEPSSYSTHQSNRHQRLPTSSFLQPYAATTTASRIHLPRIECPPQPSSPPGALPTPPQRLHRTCLACLVRALSMELICMWAPAVSTARSFMAQQPK